MDIAQLQRRLILVEYPAIVRNTDRMQETLGGINRISDVRTPGRIVASAGYHSYFDTHSAGLLH